MTGKKPSFVRAIRAKCKQCMNDWADGRIDCKIVQCALYTWQPYRGEGVPDLSFAIVRKDPRRIEVGRALARRMRERKAAPSG